MVRPGLIKLLLLIGLACHGSYLFAVNQVTEIKLRNQPKGSLALGFGFRLGQSPYFNIDNTSSQKNDNSSDLVPLYYYEGKYLFAHGTSFGVHLFDRDQFAIDLVSNYRFDRLEDSDDPFYEGIDERRQSVDSGLAFTWRSTWGELSATAVHDTLDRHEGSEADITYRYLWRKGKWLISPVASYIYQDSTLTNYYYGVSDAETTDDREMYKPDRASFVRLGLNTTYYINSQSILFANIAYETVDDTIQDSPLVDKSSLASAYFGFAYLFGNTLDETQFKGDKSRFGEWSWRINYGYTAHKTFLKVHNGEIEGHEEVDTNLAGLTIGKLLKAGKKVDYWGKFSINRRLENNLQEDFFEYNGYVMVMGTGYSPWTSRELFRYGFGFGFSYAEKISAVEQYKQRNGDAARFLNYMEAQVDFPLRNLFQAKSLQNCYFGLTVVHRSGIFASSDLLGNVSGGSDVLSTHLECKR